MNTLYPTDITDTQWNTTVQFLDDNRKRRYSLRCILNTIFHLNKTICHWRMRPEDLPYWKLVYYYFCKWKCDGTIEKIYESLQVKVQKEYDIQESPSLAIIDYQLVKMSRQKSIAKGVNRGKNIKGRKWHIIVDSLGLILAIVVHATNKHDSKAAVKTISKLKYCYHDYQKHLLIQGIEVN